MTENSFKSLSAKSISGHLKTKRIWCAAILFTSSVPLLVLGVVLIAGESSRPHRADIAVLIGLVTLGLAIVAIGLGAWFCLTDSSDEDQA